MRDDFQQFASIPVDADLWDWLARRIYYVSGDFDDPDVYSKLKDAIAEADKEHGCNGNCFFYLATAPNSFADIISGSPGRLDEGRKRPLAPRDHREALRPRSGFGESASTSSSGKWPTNSQIYRIDHYLGKETVQNILAFRFANGIFEPIWNRRYIDHVQITVAETLGVEQRGGYYDDAGALRDMVPNHILQLISLTAMEPPISFDADAVRDEQAKVLHAISPSARRRAEQAVRGQYGEGIVDGERVPAYRSETAFRPTRAPKPSSP